MTLRVTSPAFKQGAEIPARYTCDDLDVSPPLEWSPGPAGTASYALLMDDPDAPSGRWVHWVAWNIRVTTLPEDEPQESGLESPVGQIRHGTNSWDRIGYGGPCPPSGRHRYYFRVYALDRELDLEPETTRGGLLATMEGHVLDHGELMGTYARKTKK